MKLAPHLHRLGNDLVASYLINLPEGITLIDAGLPGHWNDLRHELDMIGRPLTDIRGLVLTHGDSDHIGFARRLRQATGAPVFIHSGDAHRVRNLTMSSYGYLDWRRRRPQGSRSPIAPPQIPATSAGLAQHLEGY